MRKAEKAIPDKYHDIRKPIDCKRCYEIPLQ